MRTRAFLSWIVKNNGYKVGEFTLSSGNKSTEYLDVKSVLLSPSAAIEVLRSAVEHLGIHHDGTSWVTEYACVAGPELGAVPLISMIGLWAYYWKSLYLPMMIVRKEVREHGTGQRIEGTDNLKTCYKGITSPFDGSRHFSCLLIEDVVTTGKSTISALHALRDWSGNFNGVEYKINPVTVLCVVDREEGGKEAILNEFPEVRFESLTTMQEVREAQLILRSDSEREIDRASQVLHADFV